MTDLPPHLVASNDRINAALEVALEQPPPATGTLRVCLATEEEWDAFADCDGQVVDIPEPSRRESMAVSSINQKITTLDLKLVDKTLQKGKFYLQDASLSDWEAFVTSEDQQLKSKNMEWMDGKIFIVELPSLQHDEYVPELYSVLRDATHTGTNFLRIALAAYQTNVRRLEPDLCLLPHRVLGQPPYNVQLPPGVDWDDFHTVKWEVAWSKTWADLDWKANQWATVGTVVYIVCIKLERPNLVNCSYKVHRVVHHGVNLPAMVPTPIAPPNTVVHLDSRLVLQLPAISPLPPNFPPQLDVDLFAPLAVLLANLPPTPAAI